VWCRSWTITKDYRTISIVSGLLSTVDNGSVDADSIAVFPTLPVAHEMMAASVEGVRFLLSKQRPL